MNFNYNENEISNFLHRLLLLINSKINVKIIKKSSYIDQN